MAVDLIVLVDLHLPPISLKPVRLLKSPKLPLRWLETHQKLEEMILVPAVVEKNTKNAVVPELLEALNQIS